jgi:SAM-dependent methyltransferase
VTAGPEGYDAIYAGFDSDLMRRVRREAYGEDLGQHSWVTAAELRADLVRLALGPASRLVDLGCGPCGPLVQALATTGCRGTGLDRSATALALGGARAAARGVADRLALHEGDLDRPLPFAPASFDAALSIDVLVHVRERGVLFREVARVLAPGGRFLFTDAGVAGGPVSSEERARRSFHGPVALVAPGVNERALEAAGFRVLETEDRTAALVRTSTGRREARLAHRDALEAVEGAAAFLGQQRYLETVADLARRGAVSRVLYLAEVPAR